MKRFLSLVFVVILSCSYLVAKNSDYSKIEFGIVMTVTDHIHSTELTFGTNENGTDGYDDGLDQYAPPSPPSSDVFDARFVWEGNDFIKDIREWGMEQEYVMTYQSSSDGDPIVVRWDTTGLKNYGDFKIVSEHGQADTVDMALVDSLDTSVHWDYEDELRILYTPPKDTVSLIYNPKGNRPEQLLVVNIYPNPFNPSANIHVNLKKNAKLRIEVFDSRGLLIGVLMNEFKISGVYNIKLNKFFLRSSGIYFIKVIAGDFENVKKVLFLQ